MECEVVLVLNFVLGYVQVFFYRQVKSFTPPVYLFFCLFQLLSRLCALASDCFINSGFALSEALASNS